MVHLIKATIDWYSTNIDDEHVRAYSVKCQSQLARFDAVIDKFMQINIIESNEDIIRPTDPPHHLDN